MAQSKTRSPEARARRRAASQAGLLWHGAVFLIVNAFLWFLDLRAGGLEWAFWLTIVWGIALAFHAAWYLISERESRKYQSSLDEERKIDSTS